MSPPPRLFTPQPEWMYHGHCLNTKVDMYPKDTASVIPAKQVCNPPGKQPCPVLAQCLQYALDNHEIFGVWGGTSQNQRNRIWKNRRPGQRGPVPGPGCRTNGRERLTYPTQDDAWAASPNHWPYPCDKCGMWHLSTRKRAA